MKMPAQRPHRSRQDYETPRAFLDAFEQRFGCIAFDLAANAHNAVTGKRGQYFGPGSHLGPDALDKPWHDLGGLCWLNPPFGNIGRWAKKCAEERALGAQIALLVPASVGSNWYARHVEPHAYVFALRPRISFDGKAPFPKDLILALYEPAGYRGFEPWDWRVQTNATVAQPEAA